MRTVWNFLYEHTIFEIMYNPFRTLCWFLGMLLWAFLAYLFITVTSGHSFCSWGYECIGWHD